MRQMMGRLSAALYGRDAPMALGQDRDGAILAPFAVQETGRRFGTRFAHPGGEIWIGVPRPTNAAWYFAETGLTEEDSEDDWFLALTEIGLCDDMWLADPCCVSRPEPPEDFDSIAEWLAAPISDQLGQEALAGLLGDNTPYRPGIEIWQALAPAERRRLRLRRATGPGGGTMVTTTAEWGVLNHVLETQGLPFRFGP